MTDIPGFVTRGLLTLADPRDLGVVRYANEADLRDAMALTWWLHGWTVRTEVKVPDCGRIDVYAESPDRRERVVIEVKKAIATSGQARAAFQQAHAYASYLTDGNPTAIHTFVTAGDADYAAIAAAERAFPMVWGDGFHAIAAHASFRSVAGKSGALLARAARNRRDELRHLADLASGAAAVITNRTELVAIEGGAA